MYVFVSRFDSQSWASGIIGGSIAIIVFSIFSTVIIHRTGLYIKEAGE